MAQSGQPAGPLTAATEEQWRQLALTTFGGNTLRAAAAARAAIHAQASGASADDAFTAASRAYAAPLTENNLGVLTKDHAPAVGGVVIRPSGGRALAATLASAIIAGAFTYIVRFRNSTLFVSLLAVCIIVYTVWLGVSLRASVLVQGESVTLRGLTRNTTLRRGDIDRIVVVHDTGQWLHRRRPSFTVWLFGSESTLAQIRQGAWTRPDVARLGASIGVRVEDENTD